MRGKRCKITSFPASAPSPAPIIIPSGTVVREPIKINLHGALGEPLRIEIGAGSRATVVESGMCHGCKRVDSETKVEIIVGDGARLDFHAVGQCAAGGRTGSSVEASVGKGGRLDIVDGRFGGGENASSVSVRLLGDAAHSEIKTLFFGSDGDRLDLDYRIEHFASGTTSRIITKGALADRSRVSYRGDIVIKKGLSGCAGTERADTLMLSGGARLECAPELEIGSDDVRCEHAMSVTGLDGRRLFYLMSRGMSRESAATAAILGFLSPVSGAVVDPESRSAVEALLAARLRCALAAPNTD